MRTAGNGVTFAEGREDNAVTPDQSRSEQNQTLSGRLSISSLLHNTADTLYQSSSAFSSRPSAETAPPREGPRALGLHGTSIWQHPCAAAAATAATTPPVCLAVTQSAMCVLKMLHNALLSLHSGSKRTIQQRKNCSLLFFPPSSAHCFALRFSGGISTPAFCFMSKTAQT
ncbi:hypothetical protein D4764_08G0008730 [Takifugu flavidus]|uniref:Uncharacterized protein n=1 Tax=Takifugu flavidus TaxID=433684 RepID=A0A5C6MP33_9TELE|nr:hypothetical protein D4764_08G0008730 [Takifugu flavidus]